MIAKKKMPKGLEDYTEYRTKGSRSDIIVDLLNLSAGLDMAIDTMKPGEITKKAKAGFLQLVAQSYTLFVWRIAHGILADEGIVKAEDIANLRYQFDLPDDDHDDLIIYYKFHS